MMEMDAMREFHSARLKDISNSTDGVNQFGLEPVIELRTQSANGYLYHVCESVKIYIPDLFRYHGARYDFAGALGQKGKQRKLFGAQLDLLAATQNLMAHQVD